MPQAQCDNNRHRSPLVQHDPLTATGLWAQQLASGNAYQGLPSLRCRLQWTRESCPPIVGAHDPNVTSMEGAAS